MEGSIREQYDELIEYYTDIDFSNVEDTKEIITSTLEKLGLLLGGTYLMYTPSISIRSELPDGRALHISVIFDPEINALETVGKFEDPDDEINTVVSLYDTTGKHINGKTGTLPNILEELPSLIK